MPLISIKMGTPVYMDNKIFLLRIYLTLYRDILFDNNLVWISTLTNAQVIHKHMELYLKKIWAWNSHSLFINCFRHNIALPRFLSLFMRWERKEGRKGGDITMQIQFIFLGSVLLRWFNFNIQRYRHCSLGIDKKFHSTRYRVWITYPCRD